MLILDVYQLIIIFPFVVFLNSCSSVDMFYDFAPTYTKCELDSYFDLTDEQEEWVEGDIEVTLDKEAVDRGLEILRLKYPWHYRDLFKGDYDVMAADAWLQCAVLGDIDYG